MTTTGDYLVQHSTLPSGTALAHLLALQTGSGSGEAVFASMFSLHIDAPRLSLVQRANREVADCAARSSLREETERSVAVLTIPPRLTLCTSDECWTIHAGNETSSLVVRLGDERLTVRNSDVLEMN